MEISKHRCRDGSRLRTRQLPSLSHTTFERAPNPPHIPLLSQKNEALYLAAILRARLLDAVPGGHGRGLLSRALAREEVDQFLVDFFGSPVNVLFAKGKVEERRQKIAGFSAKRLAALGVDGASISEPCAGGEGLAPASTCSSGYSELNHPHACRSTDGGRYGPLLADFDGSSFPARSTMHTLHKGDDVSELGSTAGATSSEREKGGQGQRNEHGSVCSCGSLSTLHSDSAETATTSLESKISGQSELGDEKRETRRRHRRDRNAGAVENMHFEGHLLHRVCAVNGKLPLGNDERSQDDRAVEILLENSGEDQLVRLRRNPEIMSILVRLKALSTSLADPATSGASPGSPTNVVGGGPKRRTRDLLRFAQQEYLRLFEELLGELLKIQREKSTAARAEKRGLLRELERSRNAEAALRAEAAVHAIQLEAVLAVKHALATEVAEQDAQLEVLNTEVETRAKMDRVAQKEQLIDETKKKVLLQELKEEERTLRSRFQEVEVQATKSEMGVRSMERLVAKAERTATISKEIRKVDHTKFKLIQTSKEAFTQTAANDDGLWDYQDGCTREISRNTLQRARWQVCRRFASCPSCHGLGPLAEAKDDKTKGRLNPSKDRFRDDPTLSHRSHKRKRITLDRCWAMPNVLVEFMCHLPKTAQALPIKSLRWLTREMWLILEERERIDAIDQREGQHIQDMNDFIVELFLRRHSLRQDAELQLYIFMISLKTHYRKSAAAHTFARLMSLLDAAGGAATDGSGTPGRDHDFSKGKSHKDKRDAGRSKGGAEHPKREDELLEQEVQPHNSPLGSSFLPVLLFTRRALLKRLRAPNREKAIKRFARGVALVRLQEKVRYAFQGPTPPPKADEPSHPVEDGGDKAVVVVDDHAASEAGATSARTQDVPDNSGGVPSDGKSHLETTSNRRETSPAMVARGKQTAAVGADTDAARGSGANETPPASGPDSVNSSDQHEGEMPTGRDDRSTSDQSVEITDQASKAYPAKGGPVEAGGGASGGGETKDSKKGSLGRKMARRVTGAGFAPGAAGNSLGRKKSDIYFGKKAVKEGNGGAPVAEGTAAAAATTTATAVEGQGKPRSATGEAEVNNIDLPSHILTEDYCTFWVSLEVAVRVLTIVLYWCPAPKRHAYMRSIGKTAAFVTSRGHITSAEASHSLIRSEMRKAIAAAESESASGDPAGAGVTDAPGGAASGAEDGGGGSGVLIGNDSLQDAPVVVDMDRVVELVMEVLLLKQHSIEQRLKALFTEGDQNGDGVLSFEEFNGIISRVAPHFSERRVLRMFREALTSGSEGSFAIEKSTFCDVCRQHGLVQLIDMSSLKRAAERDYALPHILPGATLPPAVSTSPVDTPPTVSTAAQPRSAPSTRSDDATTGGSPSSVPGGEQRLRGE